MSFNGIKIDGLCLNNDGHGERRQYFKDLKRYVKNTRPSRLAVTLLLIFLGYNYIIDHVFNFPTKTYGPYSDYDLDLSFRRRDIKQIDELKKIKHSISVELRDLENRQNKIQEDISNRQKSLNYVEQSMKKGKAEVERLQREINQLKNEKFEALLPKIPAPARLLATADDSIDLSPPINNNGCQMYNCFDYSRCSLYSQFPVYVYNMEPTGAEPLLRTQFMADVSSAVFGRSPYVTNDPESACLYIILVGEIEASQQENSQQQINTAAVSAWLRALPFWRGDGRNHLLVYLSSRSTAQNPLLGVDTGRAMIAQSNFVRNQFRAKFDVVVPFMVSASDDVGDGDRKIKEQIEPQVPAMRHYFLSFEGEWSEMGEAAPLVSHVQERDDEKKFLLEEESEFHNVFTDNLSSFRQSQIGGKYLMRTHCDSDGQVTHGYRSEWSLCGNRATRLSLLSQSTFVLIPPVERHDAFTATSLFSLRLHEALNSGAIPVVIGTHAHLPYAEFIDWGKAVVIIPQARITELPFLLSSFPHAEILSMRRQGRFLYETYLMTPYRIVESLLAVIRSRLQIPPMPVDDVAGQLIPHTSHKLEKKEISPGDAQSEFGMPPPEEKMSSNKFMRNYTITTIDSSTSWNEIPGPFHLYPNTPQDRILPTDAQFKGSSNGFRPICGGMGGTGKEYEESLGGNSPREQFTIVMLTYEREQVLMQAVERLQGLPHLNKVVVVWNSPNAPSSDLHWPDIGVEVAVIRTQRNSLNNRFLPYEQIETEAVLSIDDDAHLRHDEMLFGFRVWRESRDRIVGFPGRFHAWNEKDKQWNYNSNHTCELSMVLTGAAFLHKYYLYMYSYWMPAVIRETVDEFLNCEDIAINFLVSHLTRKPPIKVTSRWTFKCPGCPVALSHSDEHFNERQVCINRFAKVFGYMPLVYTQFRADSVLFKTRLPHDKQKCFRFV